MYSIRATKEVANIIRSKDNIIEQMLELKKNYRKKGVRQYINRLIYMAMHHEDDLEFKYILYCIVKYFYGLEVAKVKAPLPKLPMASYSKKYHYIPDELNDLLKENEDIITQCKALRANKNMEGLDEYIDYVFEFYDYDVALANQTRDFEIFCINKYFYGLDVPEVKPQPFDLRPYLKERTITKKEEIPKEFTAFEDIKKDDKVQILNGAFKDMVGKVSNVNKESLTVSLNLFEQTFLIELDSKTDKVLKIDDEL